MLDIYPPSFRYPGTDDAPVSEEAVRMAVALAETNGRVIQPDPEEEYLAGGQYAPLLGGYDSLASHILSVIERGGPGLADLMMTDEAVKSSVLQIVQGILAQGMQITATVDLDDKETVEDLTEDDILTAFRVEDHCQRCWKALPDPYSLLWRLTRGSMVYRTMLAEVVKQVAGSGPDQGLYTFQRIAVKSPGTWSFDLDIHGGVRGILAHVLQPDGRYSYSAVLDTSKFVILAWDPVSGNPCGEGVLTAAYDPWNQKIQLGPLNWKYIQLFAIPTTWGTPPTKEQGGGARRLINDAGQEYGDPVPAEHWLFKGLEKMKKSGSLIVTPAGTVLQFLQPPGNGAVFDLNFDRLDRRINRAILQTSGLRNRDKRSGDSEAAAKSDVQDLAVNYGKSILRECLIRDLWRVHVRQNFGEEIARRFTPEVSFGMFNREDFSRVGNTMGTLWAKGMLQDAERAPALRLMGLNFTRRRKSSPSADLQREPSQGRRPVNFVQRGAK